MNEDCLKLTTYFGERDRANGGFLADAFTDIYARHELQTSLVIRGVDGFGVKHRLRTDRLLSLSEDLPVVSIAVDTHSRIDSALTDINQLAFHGLITLERARMLTGPIGRVDLPSRPTEETKLTAYVGRQDRVGTRPAHEALVARLHQRGIAGATVLLGIDGTAHGVRQRATFFGRNAQVPVMVIAVGDGQRIAEIAPEIGSMLTRRLITLERVRVCKRDGRLLTPPHHLPETDASGLGIWQKLIVHSSEQSGHAGRPLHHQLIRRLREAGASGATSLRGIWGYHGDHRPHGDRFFGLGRRVPIVTVIIDTPGRTRDWFAIVDELTDTTGMVTSEMVPAARACGPDVTHGGLKLAHRS